MVFRFFDQLDTRIGHWPLQAWLLSLVTRQLGTTQQESRKGSIAQAATTRDRLALKDHTGSSA